MTSSNDVFPGSFRQDVPTTTFAVQYRVLLLWSVWSGNRSRRVTWYLTQPTDCLCVSHPPCATSRMQIPRFVACTSTYSESQTNACSPLLAKNARATSGRRILRCCLLPLSPQLLMMPLSHTRRFCSRSVVRSAGACDRTPHRTPWRRGRGPCPARRHAQPRGGLQQVWAVKAEACSPRAPLAFDISLDRAGQRPVRIWRADWDLVAAASGSWRHRLIQKT